MAIQGDVVAVTIEIPSRGAEKFQMFLERHLPRLHQRMLLPLGVLIEDLKYKDPIQKYVEEFTTAENMPCFESIEIETINRCNNSCSFCPVNRAEDRRPYALMDEGLFEALIHQLSDIDFNGKISLYSNNEPLLDKRIIRFHRVAREILPGTFISLFTNGILLSPEIFDELIEMVDELVIDNYDDTLRLIEPIRKLHSHIDGNSHSLRGKVKIVVRRKSAVRRTRAGQARNRSKMNIYLRSSCTLPFAQMVIRPAGGVSLCCQDALGTYTLGDCTKETLMEIWHGRLYKDIRRRILAGRHALDLCNQCDHFSVPL